MHNVNVEKPAIPGVPEGQLTADQPEPPAPTSDTTRRMIGGRSRASLGFHHSWNHTIGRVSRDASIFESLTPRALKSQRTLQSRLRSRIRALPTRNQQLASLATARV
jgi:hypothetical protein